MERLWVYCVVLCCILSPIVSGMTTVGILHYASYQIEDYVDEVTSNQSVDLSGAFEIHADGTGLVSAESRTEFFDNLFRIDVNISSEGPWCFDNRVEAEINYIFRPSDPWLNVSLSGISGDHFFESGSYFSLTEITPKGLSVLDERSWEYEMGYGFVDDLLPYQVAYELIPGRDYRLTLGAYGKLGDLREGFAELECFIYPVVAVPAPGGFLLLVIGLCFLIGGSTRKKTGFGLTIHPQDIYS